MTPTAPIPTDEIIVRLCEALSAGMDRFEARGELYEALVEKHREAVNKVIHGDAKWK